MTAGMIIGLILLPFALMILAAAGKAHREETGVPMPSRGAMKNIRRTARKKGISEAAAYSQWLLRKQKRAGIITSTPTHHVHAVSTHPAASLFSSTDAGSMIPSAGSTQRPLPPITNHRITEEAPVKLRPARVRAPQHQPFDFEHLSMMAAGHGWVIRKQAFGLFFVLDKNRKAVENPYAEPDGIATDFTHRDLEDFLLTC